MLILKYSMNFIKDWKCILQQTALTSKQCFTYNFASLFKKVGNPRIGQRKNTTVDSMLMKVHNSTRENKNKIEQGCKLRNLFELLKSYLLRTFPTFKVWELKRQHDSSRKEEDKRTWLRLVSLSRLSPFLTIWSRFRLKVKV